MEAQLSIDNLPPSFKRMQNVQLCEFLKFQLRDDNPLSKELVPIFYAATFSTEGIPRTRAGTVKSIGPAVPVASIGCVAKAYPDLARVLTTEGLNPGVLNQDLMPAIRTFQSMGRCMLVDFDIYRTSSHLIASASRSQEACSKASQD